MSIGKDIVSYSALKRGLEAYDRGDFAAGDRLMYESVDWKRKSNPGAVPDVQQEKERRRRLGRELARPAQGSVQASTRNPVVPASRPTSHPPVPPRLPGTPPTLQDAQGN